MTFFNIIIFLFFNVSACFSEEFFPSNDWTDKPNPIAASNTYIGGEFSIYAGQYPKSFNYYLDANVLSAEIFGAMYETLLSMNSINLNYDPALAEKWSISDDKKTYTFYINKKAKWSDGKPITAHDVKWTFDAIRNPKNLTGSHKVSLERFEEPVIIDDYTIRFTSKEVHWRNLGAVGSFQILCKHAFEDKDFNKINFEFPVVSALYRLGKVDEGISVRLERRTDWWNKDSKSSKGIGNFQTMKFIFFAETENAFEAFKKGLIDLFPVYMSRIWVNETKGEKFINNWVVKQKIYNSKPVGFQGFAMNNRRFPFDDISVRKAMAYLLDRNKMNSALMYSQYFLHSSYFEDLYDKKHPSLNQIIEFDKLKARELLSKAGFKANPATGYLEKKGKRFSFRFLIRDASSEKFLSIYSEDLKDLGIEMIIDKKDWAAWAKDMEEFNYDMTWASWSQGVFKDPESMWSSKEADRKSGNNITGFKDKKIDELIEKQRSIFDVAKRNEIYREIDKIIYNAHPYVLLWNINYTRLLYWNKFGTPNTVLSKYGDESSAYWYWWIDKNLEDDLYDSIKNSLSLPQKESCVYFDEAIEK